MAKVLGVVGLGLAGFGFWVALVDGMGLWVVGPCRGVGLGGSV
jgi:hypothetical protein